MLQKLFLITLLTFQLSDTLWAQRDSVPDVSALKRLSLEELINTQVVTASGTGQKLSETPSTMILITAEQIAERGYEHINDVLRDRAGTDLISTHGQVPTLVTFRGMYGDENRRTGFMIDGIDEKGIMGGIELGGASYNLHNVERIEIIRGPGSALYGANAFSGVINIITKSGKDVNGLVYQKGFGSYNTTVDNLLLGLEKKNMSIVMSGSLYNTDGPVFKNRHPQYSNSYIDNAWSFNGKISYVFDSLRTTFALRSYFTPSGTGLLAASPTEILGLPNSGNMNTGNGGTLESDFHDERGSLTETFSNTGYIESEYSINSRLVILGRVYVRQAGRSERSYVYLNIPGTNYLRRNPFAYEGNRTGSDISFRYLYSDSEIFSAGISFRQDNLERGFRGVNNDTSFHIFQGIAVTNLMATYKPRVFVIQNNFGAFAQYIRNTSLIKNTTLTLGMRYDNNSIYGVTVNPRIGIVNQLLKKVTVKLLFGSAYRAPTNFELYTDAGGTRISNHELKPEKVKSYEAIVIFMPQKTLLLRTNLFLNDLTDVIIQDVPVGGGFSQNLNSGSALTRGIELDLEYIPDIKFSAFTNVTWQFGTLHTGIIETDMPNIARIKGNASVTVRPGSLLNITLTGHWVGERSVVISNPLEKVPGYFIADFVLTTRRLFHDKVIASLRIHNLFNRKYLDPGYRAANGLLYGTVMEQPGINGLFKIAVNIY
jgi:outer membrane receptor for ferrienterochelin and colicins